MRDRDRSSSRARIPAPHHQLIFREMFNQLIEVSAPVLFWILDRRAKLRVSQAFPDHGHARRWQVPAWRARRQVGIGKIVVLVASAAMYCGNSEADGTAADVHRVRVAVITLPWIISFRVAVHAAWMP